MSTGSTCGDPLKSRVGGNEEDALIGVAVGRETLRLPNGDVAPPLTPILNQLNSQQRVELSLAEKYKFDLARAQLKAASRTSALLAGFAMVALVELQIPENNAKGQKISEGIVITLAVVTTLLVCVHLLALMMSTCILPYMDSAGSTEDSPHNKLKLYIDMSWFFSTCIGLVLFLVEIGVIFWVKFGLEHQGTAIITTAMMLPVLVIFVVVSWLIHRNRANHSIERIDTKVAGFKQFLDANDSSIKIV